MIFDIAAFKIKIQCCQSAQFKLFETFYKDYQAFVVDQKESIDFTITIVPFDSFPLSSIKFVKRKKYFYYEKKGMFIIRTQGAIASVIMSKKEIALGLKNRKSASSKTIGILLSFLRLALSICAVLKGGLPIHSSAIVLGNDGFAFSGPSGAGKSTIANLLLPSGQLLSDDLNIILPFRKNGYKIYSTPFAHPEALKKCVNRGANLKTIFFIEKSNKNKIEILSLNKIFSLLLGQTLFSPLSDIFSEKMLNNAKRLCGNVKCKRLYFINNSTICSFIGNYAKGPA